MFQSFLQKPENQTDGNLIKGVLHTNFGNWRIETRTFRRENVRKTQI
jgi:hypothetical protein